MDYRKVLGLVVVYLILLSGSAIAGEGPDSLWMRTYNRGDYEAGWSVQELSGGGYIIAGRTQVLAVGGPDVYIIRTDTNGDTLWTRKYGWPLTDEPSQVRETSSGDYIVVGKTQAVLDSTYYVLLLKVAPNGDTLWTRTYGQGLMSSYGLSVEEVSTGGYILAGGGQTYARSTDVFLIRTDTDGDTLWTKLHGTITQEEAWSVQETFDGGFIAGGNRSHDMYLVRTDINGDTLWTGQYGGPSSEMGLSVKETPDRGYILVGSTWSYGSGMSDAYFIRTDSGGTQVWSRAYGGPQRDQVNSVVVTSDAHYAAAGATESFGPSAANMWLVKMDVDGDTVWTATYGGNGDDRAYWGEETSDGGYILVGTTNSFGPPQHNVYLVKTRADLSAIPGRIDAEREVFGPRISPTPSISDVEVEFDLPGTQHARVAVYDLLGREVLVLADRVIHAGTHRITWDGRDSSGRPVPGGVYFLRVRLQANILKAKIVLLE